MPMSDEQQFALIDARIERSDLWSMACAGRITINELYDRLLHLRETWGHALYERPSRR